MKKNLLAIAVWWIAGPTAAVKTLEIARDLEDRRKRRLFVKSVRAHREAAQDIKSLH